MSNSIKPITLLKISCELMPAASQRGLVFGDIFLTAAYIIKYLEKKIESEFSEDLHNNQDFLG